MAAVNGIAGHGATTPRLRRPRRNGQGGNGGPSGNGGRRWRRPWHVGIRQVYRHYLIRVPGHLRPQDGGCRVRSAVPGSLHSRRRSWDRGTGGQGEGGIAGNGGTVDMAEGGGIANDAHAMLNGSTITATGNQAGRWRRRRVRTGGTALQKPAAEQWRLEWCHPVPRRMERRRRPARRGCRAHRRPGRPSSQRRAARRRPDRHVHPRPGLQVPVASTRRGDGVLWVCRHGELITPANGGFACSRWPGEVGGCGAGRRSARWAMSMIGVSRALRRRRDVGTGGVAGRWASAF